MQQAHPHLPFRRCATLRRLGHLPRAASHFLEHQGWWAPLATERSPPLGPASWPRHANLPLTYHPVPDIA